MWGLIAFTYYTYTLYTLCLILNLLDFEESSNGHKYGDFFSLLRLYLTGKEKWKKKTLSLTRPE